MTWQTVMLLMPLVALLGGFIFYLATVLPRPSEGAQRDRGQERPGAPKGV